MLLVGVKEDENWLISRWNLTYRIGWEKILNGTYAVYDCYQNLEILIGNKPLNIENKKDILNIEENSNLIIRGFSKIVETPIMITFYNQLNFVDVSVLKKENEFKDTNYQKFNYSLCQYMDSIELAMYREIKQKGDKE